MIDLLECRLDRQQGGFSMRFIKRSAIIASIIFVFASGLAVTSAEAQTRTRIVRPIIVRPIIYRDPFWFNRYDPWYDPFYRARYESPRQRYEREKYKRESKVDKELRELNKEQEKAMRDGVITAKESEKIMKKRRDYHKALADLNSFRRSFSGYRG
jgi:hypothetical protein